jgi:hypothetical protein
MQNKQHKTECVKSISCYSYGSYFKTMMTEHAKQTAVKQQKIQRLEANV